MQTMNIWDLREVGFTHYQVRSLVESVTNGDPDYAWVNAVLVREGMKKPKVIPDLFIDGYEQFRHRQVDQEIAALREKLLEFEQRKGNEG